jgi:hypothetical protein
MVHMKKLALLDEKQNICHAVSDIFFDKSKINRYKTLVDYCKANDLVLDDKEHLLFIKKIEKTIYEHVVYYAYLMYHYMMVSNDWGEPGEQQVKAAFCRNVLSIDPQTHLTAEHSDEFSKKVAHTIKKLGIHSMTAEAAKQQLRTFKFKLFGKSMDAFKAMHLNQYLVFAGSHKFLHVGQYGRHFEIIMGRGTQKEYHGYLVTFINKEYIRTPNNVMSMAAIIGRNNVYIRLDVLQIIFSQKWLQIFDYDDLDIMTIYTDIYWNIAEGLKQKVLELWGISSKKQLIQKQNAFINDMADIILHHELGHGIIQNTVLSGETNAIGEATKLYGETIYTAMLEFLADVAPLNDGLRGPLQHMIALNQTDPDRAKRLYLMYMSDTWFYNTDDVYMYTYSDIMALFLSRYITADRIDFDMMATDLMYPSHQSTSLISQLIQLYNADIQKIKSICEQATYTVAGKPVKYPVIREFLISEFRKNDGYVHVDTSAFLVPYWTNVLGYIQTISNESDSFDTFLTTQKDALMRAVMTLTCGPSVAKYYNFDPRSYVCERMAAVKYLAVDTTE